VVLHGILYLLVGAFLISIVLAPSLLLAMPVTFFAERRNTFGVLFFGMLGAAYNAIIIYFSCAWVFNTYTSEIPNGNSIFPYLLWAYGIATAPWVYMASKEAGIANKEGGGAIGTFMSIFFSKLGLVVVVVATGFFGIALSTSLYIFAIFLAIEVVLASVLAVLLVQEEKALGLLNNKEGYIDMETSDAPQEEDDELSDWDLIKDKE
jgi:hypothetical protein